MNESGEYSIEGQTKSENIETKKVASMLGEHVAKELSGLKDKSKNAINRILYSHTMSLFCLEAFISKAAGVYKHDENLIDLGKRKIIAAELKGLNGVVKKVKTDSVLVGDHMTFRRTNYTGFASKELSDGEIVRPGDRIGEIDFVKDVPKLGKDANLFVFTRYLYNSAQKSLRELAELCAENDPSVDGIKAFHGTSHLVGPLAKRLGFDIYEIANPIKRAVYKKWGKAIAKNVAGESLMWQEYQKNFKPPREAYISRSKLVELFGNNSDD